MSEAENWIQELTDTVGLGNIVLQGGVTNAARFSDAFTPGQSNIAYSIEDGNNREAGLGTLVDADTFSRDNVRSTFEGGIYNRGTSLTPITLSGSAKISCTLSATDFEEIQDHLADVSNPHSIDASTIGLENCDNTADADKPVSTAQQTALDGKEDDLGNPADDDAFLTSSAAGSRIWLPWSSNYRDHNFIINPDFQFYQRNGVPDGVGLFLVDGAFVSDRWQLKNIGGGVTVDYLEVSQHLYIDGGYLETVIELPKLAGKTVTLSMDSDGDAGANGIIDVDGTTPISGLLPLTGTIHADSTGHIKIRIEAPNSGKYKHVKLELGSKATPYHPRPYAEELHLCYRYYENSFTLNTRPDAGLINGHKFLCTPISTTGLYTSGIRFTAKKPRVPDVTIWTGDLSTIASDHVWEYFIPGSAWTPMNETILYGNNVNGFAAASNVESGLTTKDCFFGVGNWEADGEIF
jgi:hypothetical protein